MPSSGWSQCSASQSSSSRIAGQPRCPTGSPRLVGEVDAVQRLAVDVELELIGGAVADPDRARAAVARPVLERLLLEVGGAVHPVHDVQRAAVAARPLGDPVPQPAAELRRLLGEPQPQQRVDGERGVAHPGVAVVPVTLAADLLGQAGGRRGHQPAGRGVGHQLQRDRRALQHLPPAPGVGGAAEPGAPERDGLVEQRPDLGQPDLPRRPGGGRLQHERHGSARRSGRSTTCTSPFVDPTLRPAARRRARAPRAGSASGPSLANTAPCVGRPRSGAGGGRSRTAARRRPRSSSAPGRSAPSGRAGGCRWPPGPTAA